MIDTQLHRLVQFGLQHHLLEEEDRIYTLNQLLGVLQLDEIQDCTIPDEQLATATPILEEILAYAIQQNLLEDTQNERDLFDTKIMNCLMPRPSEVIQHFQDAYAHSPKQATDEFYAMSIASNYIRKDYTDKNICWKTTTIYGELDITINLSKPEKDPRDIAKAKLVKSSSYPKCLLCKENEGYYGRINHPARNTHRIIPMAFSGEHWFLQYSPYTYYNEHCIVFNAHHIPMKIHRKTFENLLGFLDVLPHYFVGSNADLPIVGGSILSHDHYQGGCYSFAMEKAEIMESYTIKGYEDIEAGRVKWPMSVLRLRSSKKEKLISLCDHILSVWRDYDDFSLAIQSHTSEPHNTITPIARKFGSIYEIDLVLRNNRTDSSHPLGIFHPHEDVHHIKKENIGLIEVMGLAVLPARLKEELKEIKTHLLRKDMDLTSAPALMAHNDWYKHLIQSYPTIKECDVDQILRDEIGHIFERVLEDAGVYKLDEAGIQGFQRFIQAL